LADKSDNELIAAVGLGEMSALGVLFERHHEWVHSLCFRLTGDPSASDDLVQESFLRVLRYSSGFAARAAFTTWMYRLVRNVCYDHLKAESRTRVRAELSASEQIDEAQEQQETDTRLETVRNALYKLSPEKREVLVLSRYEGLSYAEIAERCESTVGAIKVRAHRAMRELRQRIEELEHAP
jgi:RNA polymerase sigma-70 factor (ECF subfamily)